MTKAKSKKTPENPNEPTKETTESKNPISVGAFIISIVALCFSIMTFSVNQYNKSLILEKEVELKNTKNNAYEISFKTRQGGVKKAYIADIRYTETDVKIHYDEATNSIKSNKIEIQMQDAIANGEVTNFKNDFGNIKDIKQFALVVLDTTDHWNVFYYMIRPKINFSQYVYSMTLTSNGEEKANNQKKMKNQEMKSIMIDGTLTNISTIRTEMIVFNKIEKYDLLEEPMTTIGKNGEKLTNNPNITIEYTMPEAEDIYDNIQKIFADIKSLKI